MPSTTSATQDPADQNHFVLSAKDFDAFVEALDPEPVVDERLVKLFARPNRFASRPDHTPDPVLVEQLQQLNHKQ